MFRVVLLSGSLMSIASLSLSLSSQQWCSGGGQEGEGPVRLQGWTWLRTVLHCRLHFPTGWVTLVFRMVAWSINGSNNLLFLLQFTLPGSLVGWRGVLRAGEDSSLRTTWSSLADPQRIFNKSLAGHQLVCCWSNSGPQLIYTLFSSGSFCCFGLFFFCLFRRSHMTTIKCETTQFFCYL